MNSEDERLIGEFKKKRFLKRKFLGLPIITFIIFGVVLVAATGAYYYMFYYTISADITLNYFNMSGHAHNINNELIITGNLNPILDCNIGEFCTTGDINITNPTIDNQTVYINQQLCVDGNYGGYYNCVPSLYTQLGWGHFNMIHFLEGDFLQGEYVNASTTIEPNSTITFRAKYKISIYENYLQIPSMNCTLGQPCTGEPNINITELNLTKFRTHIIISSNMTEY